MAAPLAEISFMPTGGIDRENMLDYLDLPNVVAVGGSWMIDKTALAEVTGRLWAHSLNNKFASKERT